MQNLAVHALLNGAEGATETTSNIMDQIFNHMDNALELSGRMLNFIVVHPLYGLLFACSLIPVGIGIVTMIKHSAKS